MFAKILLIAGFTLIFFVTSSCSAKKNNINKKFEERYGGQIDQILDNKDIQKRNFSVYTNKKSKFNFDPNFKLYSSPSQILSKESLISKPASFETHKLFLKSPQDNLPSVKTYLDNRNKTAASRIPSDIFDIRYNTKNHPPFQVTGIDFDIIVIPQQDAFGVSSSLNKKLYPIVGNNYISRNVNSIVNDRSLEDIEFTEKLITEQKAIRKQIAVANLYKSDNFNELNKKHPYDEDNTDEKWVTKKRKLRSDPVNKIIELQVISRNLKTSYKAQNASQNKPKK